MELRRPENPDNRTRRPGWPGGIFLEDRKLPWISLWYQRSRSGPSRHMQGSVSVLNFSLSGGRASRRRPVPVRGLADGREVSSHVLLLATACNIAGWRSRADLLTAAASTTGGARRSCACKDENVYIVGGATVRQAALHFAKFACTVTMLVRAGAWKQVCRNT